MPLAEAAPPVAPAGAPPIDPDRARSIILLLMASVAILMTGYGVVVPVLARRLSELGGGVEALGLMTLAFAAGQFVTAPVLGSLGDRIGRRPIILFSLGGFVALNLPAA